MILRNFTLLSITLLCSSTFAASLSYKELSKNNFELYLENETSLEISQAQQMLYEPAVKICQGKKPLYGKYKFKGVEPISGSPGKTSSFNFSQQITCVDEINSAALPQQSNLSESQKEQIKGSVRALTGQYLSAKENGNFKIAYGMLTAGMKDISAFAVWESRESKYFKVLGGLLNRDIWRLTVYDNPANAPQPGIYIAADYESKYENAPIYCGYVIWFLHPDSNKDYKVMREEFGSISNDMIKKIPPQDLESVRKQIGCMSGRGDK